MMMNLCQTGGINAQKKHQKAFGTLMAVVSGFSL